MASLIGTLNATVPTLTGDSTFSSDPSTNLLVGRDGAAGDCSDAYTRSWGAESNKTYIPSEATRVVSSIKWPPATDTGAPVLPFFQLRSNLSYCPCCPQEWLDYVLSSVQHQQPTNNPTMQVVAVKSATPFAVPWAGNCSSASVLSPCVLLRLLSSPLKTLGIAARDITFLQSEVGNRDCAGVVRHAAASARASGRGRIH